MVRSPGPLFALAAVAVALGLGGAGCGSAAPDGTSATGGDRAAVRKLAVQLREYLRTRDAKGLCGMFERSRMEAWIGENCVRIFRLGLSRVPTPEQLRIERVEVEGDRATVSFGYGDVDFTRIDGQWHLVTPDVKPAGAGGSAS